MNPAQRALWYVESHLAEPITLDEIAAVSGVSRFHIVRAFAAATGLPVMRYVRARRLTEAARSLANGAPDILSLALEADYGSHEAFTRAFRDQFGTTPEAVRAARCTAHLRLQEPILMDSTISDQLATPRFETAKAFLVAGTNERISCDNGAAIPGLWQRFHQEVADIPARIGDRSPMASAATVTMPAISTTSQASRSPISPSCRAVSAVSGSPSSAMRCSPTPTTSPRSGAPSTRSGISGCRPPA